LPVFKRIRKNLLHGSLFMISRIAVMLFLTISTSLIVFSQTQPKPLTKEEEQKKQEELRKKIKEALDAAISDLGLLRMPENKAFFQVQIAGLLWDYDEKGARSLIDDVKALTAMLINDPKFKPPTSKWDERRQLRGDLIRMIAQRDPHAALDFLRKTTFVIPPESMQSDRAHYVFRSEAGVEQQLALRVAANDPKRALAMAEESLEKGISSELHELVRVVFQKDKEAGKKLSGAILSKLKGVNLTEKSDQANLDAVYFALRLLEDEYRSRRPEQAIGEKMPGDKKQVWDDQALREWNNYIIQASLAMVSKGIQTHRDGLDFIHNGLSMLMKLLPDIEKLSPGLVANFKTRYGQLLPKLDNEAKFVLETANAKAEDLLALAEKSQGGLRRDYIRRALRKAHESEGNVDLARKIIDEHITDPAERESMTARIDERAKQYLIEQGKIEDAAASVMSLESGAERAIKLADLSGRALRSGDKKLAAEFLERALGALPQPVETRDEYEAIVRIIYHSIDLDRERSFEMCGTLIEPINQLMTAILLVQRYQRNRSEEIRDEIPARQLRGDFPSKGFDKVIIALSKADFDRAIGLIDQIRQPEFKLHMKLLAIQAATAE
jgi:hypothetical protein